MGNMKKKKTDEDGKHFYFQGNIPDSPEAVWEEIKQKNGCHFYGDFTIKKVIDLIQVPGNFHISSHAFMNII